MEIEDVRYKKNNRPLHVKALLAIFIVLIVLLVIFIALWQLGFLDIFKIFDDDLGFDANEILVEYETDDEADSLEQVEYVSGDVSAVEKESGVIDIVLVGVDNRDEDKFTGRSDVLMVMRVDTDSGEIKLASFMRDTLVEIEGHDQNRINTAYHFGSIELLYNTLESNFGITPDYYMVVNFYGMEDIIDALGGVDVEINSNEISNLNSSIKEINNEDSAGKVSYINSAGLQHLNGRQAVAYMRIRKVGLNGLNGDAARILRQQIVLSTLFDEATSMSLSQIPDMIEALSQYVRTDIPLTKMVSIGTAILDTNVSGLQTFSYPNDYVIGGYKGMSIIQPADFDEEIAKLHDFLEN